MFSNKTRADLEDEVKKLIKVNNSNFVEHQRVEQSLLKQLREKKNEITNIIEQKGVK